MSRDSTMRWFRTAHATAVAAVVATGIYAYVPPFVPVFASFGPDIPISGRILAASYPFAFLLPLAAAACGIFLNRESPWRRLLVPLTYVVGIAVVCFVVLALYAPVFELSAAQEAKIVTWGEAHSPVGCTIRHAPLERAQTGAGK